MQEATLLVFGNPRVGTPQVLAQPLLALDLPLRVLVWESVVRARVSYQEPGRRPPLRDLQRPTRACGDAR